MNEKEQIRTSKFLSLVLRHDPAHIGLTLDPAGWVEVQTLLDAMRAHGRRLEREVLEFIVAECPKQRFAFSEDRRRIRASQGHSVDVELGYTAQTPPAQLYHGTAARFLESIRAEGLRKGERHHVHLSAETSTAEKVGSRRGKPVVLVVRAAAMQAAGFEFFVSENGVWLVDHVPPEYIEFPAPKDSNDGSQKPRGARSTIAAETVAICRAGSYTAYNGQVVEIATSLRDAVGGTKLFTLGDALTMPEANSSPAAKIGVTSDTTVAAALRMACEPGGRLAVLNFASAKNPGGGFLGGAEAQEESLARSSGLYPCLLAAPAYYEQNRACGTALYLDLAIWSPDVPFFRNDKGTLLAEPSLVSVITSPAPNRGAVASNEPGRLPEVEPVLKRRAAFVLQVAVARGVRRLVLGAWGCGVFRNDPTTVAQAFAVLLRPPAVYSTAFDEVVFAIFDRSAEQSVFRAFSEVFS